MTDLIQLLNTLVTPQGDILVKGVDDMVPRPDEAEK
jgi:Cys-Gly metallodipeptidase DUG1